MPDVPAAVARGGLASGSGISDREAPLVSAKGLALAMAAAVLCSWPMLLVTAPLGYFDTLAYYETGREVMLRLMPLDPVAGTAQLPGSDTGQTAAGGVRAIRSFVYGTYVFLSSQTPLGLMLTTVLQATATLMLLFAFVPRGFTVTTGAAIAGGALLAGVSTLPWFAAYAMPDILAAALILFYALLVGRIDRIGTGWQIAFTLVAAFAIASHYGHIPLATGLVAVVIAVRAARRLAIGRTVILAVLPVALAVGANVAGSGVVLGDASMAPKRFPIMLARFIDDGPGALHLAEACPERGYAICEVFPGGVPADLNAFLWEDGGIRDVSPADLDRIRAEEAQVLWDIVMAYPVAQLSAFAGNALQQLIQVGTGEVHPLQKTDAGAGVTTSAELLRDHPVLAAFDWITKGGTLAGVILLAFTLWRGVDSADWNIVIVVVLGLIGNAVIFGGLSVPVDRYGARVVWLLPAFGVLFWLNQRSRRPPAAKNSIETA